MLAASLRLLLAPVMALLLLGASGLRAQTCSEAEIAAAVDEGSGKLRRLNATSAPQIDAKLRELQKLRGWSDHDLDDKAYQQLEDDTIRAWDRETNALVTRMEGLSDASGGPAAKMAACERLVELRQTLDRLREIAQDKARYLTAKLDRELAGGPVSAPPAIAPVARAETKPPEPKPPEPMASQPKAAAPPPAWTTTTRVEPRNEPTLDRAPPAGTAPLPLPPPLASGPATYTREEISAAGEGFFGKVSTGLAGVIDYAFQQAGRPAGYILGDEGGGAFLAGLRYGKGMLHLKGAAPITVYWRGPSIGYDFGAAGSRLMVLVYNVQAPEDLFDNFAGIDGSAYLVGGVGITFLTNGKKAMAPIRSGIGLRLGANVGYLKFSPRPSWNPF